MLSENKVIQKLHPYLVILKYLFSIIVTILTYRMLGNEKYLLVSLVELAVIIIVSNTILAKNKVMGHIVHFALLLVYNVQTLVMYFGGSFTSLIMLTNLESLNSLRGKFSEYVQMIVPMVILTLIPAKQISVAAIKDKKMTAGLTAVIAIVLEIAVIWIAGTTYSPICNVYKLYSDYKAYKDMNTALDTDEDILTLAEEFYNEGIDDYIAKPDNLVKQPNVILIFTEGLSKNIIYDDRDVMLNVQQFAAESLSFDNYYNHTFATYRGLIGQLYSGYQLKNFDASPFYSLQSILKAEGYHTTFINTEPNNEDFTNYLTDFGFDELLTDNELAGKSDIFDKAAYDFLFDVVSRLHNDDEPFFTAIYTYGTHVSFDSPNEVYGDGSDPLLNRFYNLDWWFGEFLEKFKESELYDDTIIVFTTDHASYVDSDFLHTFPEYDRMHSQIDEIPLFIFHKGIQPESIDAAGRNSLCLAPTVLDYLDISSQNFFLGESLFAKSEESEGCEYVFHNGTDLLMTDNGKIVPLRNEQRTEFEKILKKYFTAKAKGYVPDEYKIKEENILRTEVSDDFSTMKIELSTHNSYDKVAYAVWSDECGQDDLKWYVSEEIEDDLWYSEIDLRQHSSTGLYTIHVYVHNGEESKHLISATEYVSDYPTNYVTVQETDDNSIEIALRNVSGYTDIVFPVWSAENDQDDIVWYKAVSEDENTWKCIVNIADHCQEAGDTIIIHVYGKPENGMDSEFISGKTIEIQR